MSKTASEKKANPIVRFLRWLLPWKGDRARLVVTKLAFLVFLAAFITCGWVLLDHFGEENVAVEEYNQARELIGDEGEDDPDVEPIVLPARYRKAFGALYRANQDFCGWVTIDGTSIDYPVVQGADREYYLHRTFYRNYNFAGTPFLDPECSFDPESQSDNLLVYGHNLKNGSMFHDLINYKDVAYYKEHPIVRFDTVYEDHAWKILGLFFADVDSSQEDVFPYYRFFDRRDDDEFYDVLNEAMQRSYFTTTVDVEPGDKLLMLSTCDTTLETNRVVLLARMVRPGESEEVDVSGAQANAVQYFPRNYVERFGGTYRPYDPSYVYYSPTES